jgi:hypothetical protein
MIWVINFRLSFLTNEIIEYLTNKNNLYITCYFPNLLKHINYKVTCLDDVNIQALYLMNRILHVFSSSDSKMHLFQVYMKYENKLAAIEVILSLFA